MRKKGYVYTLEVLIAVSIMFISLVLIFRTAPTKPELELSLIKEQGFDALLYLDQKGDLRRMVSENNETGIEYGLKTILPLNVNFETDVCMSNCDDTNVPSNRTIIVVDYYISSYMENYLGKRVRLWLWREF